MEIFNATSKQMDTSNVANTPTSDTVDSIATLKEVKNTSTQTMDEKNAQDKEEIKEQLNRAVDDLNSQMETLNTNIFFGFNDKIDAMYVDVKERSTGKLIRKFPSEEAMKLTEHFKEIIGIIFDKKG